jgi:hypothetical protein
MRRPMSAGWAFTWEFWDEVGGFTGDCVLGVDEACEWCQVGADGVDGVSDVVAAEYFLAVAAL